MNAGYQDAMKEFIETYYQKKGDIGQVIHMLGEYDFSSYIHNSKDIQLLEVSYEYHFSQNERNSDFRIALFGVQKDFFEKLRLQFPKKKFAYQKLYDFYDASNGYLKEPFLSASLTFDIDGGLSEIKIYFDTLIQQENPIFGEYFSPSFYKLIEGKSPFGLASMTLGEEDIVDLKLYIPTNPYFQKVIDTLLKDNEEYQKYKQFPSFDILFRFGKTGLIESIKLYYEIRNNPQLSLVVEKYFSGLFYEKIRHQTRDELGIDFDVKKGINKLNYYIGLFK